MKRIIIATMAFFAIGTISAFGQIKFGGGLSYGTEIENIGINVRGLYQINEKFAGVAGVNYFLPKNDVNMFDINLDAHYGFNEMFYGVGGLNYTSVSVDIPSFNYGGVSYGGGTADDSAVGLNVGAGVKFAGRFFGEAKYVLSDYDQLVLTIGITFGGKE